MCVCCGTWVLTSMCCDVVLLCLWMIMTVDLCCQKIYRVWILNVRSFVLITEWEAQRNCATLLYRKCFYVQKLSNVTLQMYALPLQSYNYSFSFCVFTSLNDIQKWLKVTKLNFLLLVVLKPLYAIIFWILNVKSW